MIMMMMMSVMMTGDWATDCRGPEHVTPEASGLISEETEFGVGDNPVSCDDVCRFCINTFFRIPSVLTVRAAQNQDKLS